MIFVTVGSQMPFDRLVEAVDRWAGTQTSAPEVRVQHCGGKYIPKHMEGVAKLSPIEFDRHCQMASLVVAHAGMGSIFTALTLGKPIVILPRRGDLKETRNNHQVATARWLSKRPGVFVANNESELVACIQQGLAHAGASCASPDAPAAFIEALKKFIDA